MPSRRHPSESLGEAGEESHSEGGPRPPPPPPPPDPPSSSVKKPHGAVSAGKGRASLRTWHKRQRIRGSAGELRDIPRSRPPPVVLEEEVHDEPRTDHHTQDKEDPVSPQRIPPARDTGREHPQAREYQGCGDPGRGSVEHRPGEPVRSGPRIRRARAVEETRREQIQRCRREQYRGHRSQAQKYDSLGGPETVVAGGGGHS